MQELARQLWDARRLGTTIDADAVEVPADQAAAYATQEAVVALSGLPRGGYKVGSTSAEAQAFLGTNEPACGALLSPYILNAPAKLRLVREHMPAVEGEFAVRLRHDLPAREQDYELDEVVEAVESIAGAIEVVGTRFAGGLNSKGRLLTTADCGVNIALVVGPWRPFDGDDLRDHAVQMTVNDVVQGSGTGARALGDPFNVLLWLANHLSKRGLGLSAGEIVSTGTCTGLDAVHPGDIARAEFGTLGQVEIAFE